MLRNIHYDLFHQPIMTFFHAGCEKYCYIRHVLKVSCTCSAYLMSQLKKFKAGAGHTAFYKSHPSFILWQFWSCSLISSVTQRQRIHLLHTIWSLMMTFLHTFNMLCIVLWYDSNSAFETSFVSSFLHGGTNGATRCRHGLVSPRENLRHASDSLNNTY